MDTYEWMRAEGVAVASTLIRKGLRAAEGIGPFDSTRPCAYAHGYVTLRMTTVKHS
jgi:hypothetical protein